MIFRILLFCIMILACGHVQADFPTSSAAGVGEWHDVPFGKMRLISCTSGVKDLSMVVGGLEVNLNHDWVMKKPSLKPLSTQLPSWIENPVVAGNGKDVTYRGKLFFPVVYARNASESTDFTFGVEGDFPVCQKEQCLTLPVRLTLPLSVHEAKYTSVCHSIIKRQQSTPLPAASQGVTGTASAKGTNVFLTFAGIRRPEIAFLQTTTEEDFNVLTTRLEENGLVMHILTEPWEIGSSKEWILLTNKGLFRVPVMMESIPKQLPVPQPALSVWWLGWKLFFMTPLFIWWGLGVARTKKKWQSQIIRFLCLFPLALLGKILFQNVILFDTTIFDIFLLALICFVPPQKYLWALGLFVVWPLKLKAPELWTPLFVVWFLLMWLEIALPFAFLYLKADDLGSLLRQIKKQNFFGFNLIFLFPTLFLLGTFIWNWAHPTIYQASLNPSGFTIVCQNCNRWKGLSGISFVDPDTPFGTALKNVFHRQKEDFVLWQNKGQRMVLPPHTSPKTVRSFLINWKKYHAADMP